MEDDTDSPERMVLYYTDALSPDEKSNPLSDTLRINEAIAKQVTVETDESTVQPHMSMNMTDIPSFWKQR